MAPVTVPLDIVVTLSEEFLRSREFPPTTTAVVAAAAETYAEGLCSDLGWSATPVVRVEPSAEEAAFGVAIAGQNARAPMSALYPPKETASDPHGLARQICLTIYRNRELTVTPPLVDALRSRLSAGHPDRRPAPGWVDTCARLLAARGLAPTRLADHAIGEGEAPSSPAALVDELSAGLSTSRVKLFHSGARAELVMPALENERDRLFGELGVLAPAIELEATGSLGPSQWQMRVNDVRLPPFFAEAHACVGEVGAELKRQAPALLSRRVLELLLDLQRHDWQFVVNGALARVGVGGILSILRGLVQDDLSIRNLPAIADAVASVTAVTARDTRLSIVLGPNTGGLAYTGPGRGLDQLTVADYEACVRMRLGDSVAYKYAPDGSLSCLLLAQSLEEELTTSEEPVGHPDAAPIVRQIWEGFQQHRAVPRVVLLTGIEVRRKVRDLIREEIPDLPVLSYQELPVDLSLVPLGHVG